MIGSQPQKLAQEVKLPLHIYTLNSPRT
jgi:hypothetical protein